MSMNSESEFGFGYGGMMSAPYRLRIAVPSFGFLRPRAAPVAAPRTGLSRDELLRLFQGELGKPKVQKLTEGEQREQDAAHALRRALYPEDKA